jgi:hypothetical protein
LRGSKVREYLRLFFVEMFDELSGKVVPERLELVQHELWNFTPCKPIDVGLYIVKESKKSAVAVHKFFAFFGSERHNFLVLACPVPQPTHPKARGV